MTYRLGVDVGGTFTDILLIDEDSGATFRAKTSSTPEDQSVGVLRGIDQACAAAGIERTAVGDVLHGTTVATNAILEGKGARVGLVTTHGLPPGAADRPVVRPRRPGRLDHLAQARAARRAGGHRRGRRTHRQRRHRSSPSSTRTTSAPSCGPWRGSGIEALTHQPDQLLRQRRPRAARRASSPPRSCPASPVSLSSAVLPELREYERTHHHGRQRRTCSRRCSATSPTSSASCATPGVSGALSILRSDGGLASAGGRRRQPGQPAAVRPGGRRDRRGVGRRAGRVHRLPHLRHGRHLDRRRAGAGPHAAHRPRDHGRRPQGRAPRRSTSARSAPAAAPSRTSRR